MIRFTYSAGSAASNVIFREWCVSAVDVYEKTMYKLVVERWAPASSVPRDVVAGPMTRWEADDYVEEVQLAEAVIES